MLFRTRFSPRTGSRRDIRRFKFAILLSLMLVACISGILLQGEKISHLLWPLWDTPPRPFQHLTHFYYENASMAHLCALHGWQVRESPRRVFDVVLFSNELDILEIRWQELLSVVTKVLIVESNTTFMGTSKPLLFWENMQRFSFAEPKIVYGILENRKLEKGENPFVLEAIQRMTANAMFDEAEIEEGDLVIMSDVDEIPSSHTVNLLRWCEGIPEVLHLGMDFYLYSFEFLVGKNSSGSWRASASIYQPGITYYSHGRKTDLILPAAGWHCSYCFPYLEDFSFKMQAFSNADRVRSKSFLDHKRIQERICKGADLFDMLPKANSLRNLLKRMGDVRSSYTALPLPSYLVQNPEKFSFLLPGNCLRPSSPST